MKMVDLTFVKYFFVTYLIVVASSRILYAVLISL